jgi:hypothetical protein
MLHETKEGITLTILEIRLTYGETNRRTTIKVDRTNRLEFFFKYSFFYKKRPWLENLTVW